MLKMAKDLRNEPKWRKFAKFCHTGTKAAKDEKSNFFLLSNFVSLIPLFVSSFEEGTHKVFAQKPFYLLLTTNKKTRNLPIAQIQGQQHKSIEMRINVLS